MNTKHANMKTDFEQKSNRTLGIRGRLIFGFSAILLTLVIAILIALVRINNISSIANNVINTHLPTYDAFLDLNGQIYSAQASLEGFLITHDPTFKNDYSFAWTNIQRVETMLDDFSKTWSGDTLIKWETVKPLISQLHTLETEMLQSPANTASLSQALVPLTHKIYDILDGFVGSNGDRSGGLFDLQYNVLQQGAQDIITSVNFLRTMEYVLLFAGILVSLIIAFYTSSGILRYINIFREHSNSVATGNLTGRILVRSSDEMGQLGHDLNTMTDSLSSVTRQITDACHQMVTTLEEVRKAVEAQSSGAAEQSSSINQITASLDEIEKSSTQTMDKAKSLGEITERTQEKGQLGLSAVEQSIAGMDAVRKKVEAIAQTILDLSNQTRQVGEITAAVNTLSQQSKMLALNASIEAAKAGEAGKGFAVVAAEVKNLAEQSEQSTVQVQKILEDISHATEKAVMATEEGTKGVDQGTNLVEQTGEIVRNLCDVIREASIASQQIEAAIRQEGIGIEQITAGMNEINQVTSSFVTSVKQTTDAMENLTRVAKSLKEHVDVYQID